MEYDVGDDQELAGMHLAMMPRISLKRNFDTHSVNIFQNQNRLELSGNFSDDNQYNQERRHMDTVQFIDRQQDESNQSLIMDEINFLSPASIYKPNIWERNKENRINAKKVPMFDFDINFTFREEGKSDHPNQIKNSSGNHDSKSSYEANKWNPNSSFNYFHQNDHRDSNGDPNESIKMLTSNESNGDSAFSSYRSQQSSNYKA